MISSWNRTLRAASACFALGVGLSVGGGCSSVDVRTTATPTADLSRYRTFNYAPKEIASVSPTNADRVKSAVAHELTTRGYTQADQADLQFEILLQTQEKTYDKKNPAPEGQSASANLQQYYGFLYDKHWTAQDVIHYTEGSLIFHAIDLRTGQLVWEGIATGVLYQDRPDEQVERRIKEAVQAVFKKYPKAR